MAEKRPVLPQDRGASAQSRLKELLLRVAYQAAFPLSN